MVAQPRVMRRELSDGERRIALAVGAVVLAVTVLALSFSEPGPPGRRGGMRDAHRAPAHEPAVLSAPSAARRPKTERGRPDRRRARPNSSPAARWQVAQPVAAAFMDALV